MTAAQNAERVVRETFVFVRKARREGHSNHVTRLALQETAARIGVGAYSIRTAERLARREAALQGETHLLDLGVRA